MKHLRLLLLSTVVLAACGGPGSYRNKEAGVSFAYPTPWEKKMIDDVPNEYKSERVSVTEGGVQVTWGRNLGGTCVENNTIKPKEKMTLNGKVFDVCHVVEA